jgi:hypothetical protein
VFTGLEAWNGLSKIQIYEKVSQKERPDIPENLLNYGVVDIIQGCWKHESQERLSFHEIVQKLKNLV